MEAGIVQLQAERVLEVDAAAYCLGRGAVRVAVQELQHAHRGQLRRGQPRAPVTRIPSLEVLVAPQSVEPVTQPHRRRPRRVRRPRDPRRELRNHAARTRTHRHHYHLSKNPDHRNLSSESMPHAQLRSPYRAVDSRSPTESFNERIAPACWSRRRRFIRRVIVQWRDRPQGHAPGWCWHEPMAW